MIKKLLAMQEIWVGKGNIWVGKIPWRRKWQLTPVFLPGKLMDRGTWRAIAHRVAKEPDVT